MFKKAALSILFHSLLGIISCGSTAGAEPAPPPDAQAGSVQSDPRYPGHGVTLRYTRGTKPEKGDHGAYVIIAWANPPKGSTARGYQFWGDHRIIGKEEIESALAKVLEERPRDVIVLGNEWGAGSELDPLLEKLSARLHIDVRGGSTSKFDSVDLKTERKDVSSLIAKAIDQAQEAKREAPNKGSEPVK